MPSDAQQSWENLQFTLDRSATGVAITNPVLAGAAATVTKPYLQLAGYANEQLATVTYTSSTPPGTSTTWTLYDQPVRHQPF